MRKLECKIAALSTDTIFRFDYETKNTWNYAMC